MVFRQNPLHLRNNYLDHWHSFIMCAAFSVPAGEVSRDSCQQCFPRSCKLWLGFPASFCHPELSTLQSLHDLGHRLRQLPATWSSTEQKYLIGPSNFVLSRSITPSSSTTGECIFSQSFFMSITNAFRFVFPGALFRKSSSIQYVVWVGFAFLSEASGTRATCV